MRVVITPFTSTLLHVTCALSSSVRTLEREQHSLFQSLVKKESTVTKDLVESLLSEVIFLECRSTQLKYCLSTAVQRVSQLSTRAYDVCTGSASLDDFLKEVKDVSQDIRSTSSGDVSKHVQETLLRFREELSHVKVGRRKVEDLESKLQRCEEEKLKLQRDCTSTCKGLTEECDRKLKGAEALASTSKQNLTTFNEVLLKELKQVDTVVGSGTADKQVKELVQQYLDLEERCQQRVRYLEDELQETKKISSGFELDLVTVKNENRGLQQVVDRLRTEQVATPDDCLQKCATAQQENTELKKNVHTVTEEKNSVETKNRELEVELGECKKTRTALSQQLDAAIRENGDLKKQNEHLTSAASTSLEESKTNLDKALAEKQTVSEQLETARKEKADVERKNDYLLKQVEYLTSAATTHSTSLEESKTNLDKALAEKQTISEQLETARKEKTEVDGKLGSTVQEVEQLKVEKENLQRAKTEVENELTKLQQSEKELRTEKENAERDFKNKLTTCEGKLKDLNTEKEVVKRDLNKLGDEREKLGREYDDLNRKFTTGRENLLTVTEQLVECKKQVQTLEEIKNTLTTDLHITSEREKTLEEKVSTLEGNLRVVEHDRSEKETKVRELETKLTETTSLNKVLNEDLSTLLTHSSNVKESFQLQVDHLVEERDTASRQVELLLRSGTSGDAVLSEQLRNEVTQLRKDLEIARQEVDKLQKLLSSKTEEVGELQVQLFDANKKTCEVEGQLQDKTNSLLVREGEVSSLAQQKASLEVLKSEVDSLRFHLSETVREKDYYLSLLEKAELTELN